MPDFWLLCEDAVRSGGKEVADVVSGSGRGAQHVLEIAIQFWQVPLARVLVANGIDPESVENPPGTSRRKAAIAGETASSNWATRTRHRTCLPRNANQVKCP